MREQILEKIRENFKLSEKETQFVESLICEQMNLPRLAVVIDTMVQYHINEDVLVAYVLFQFSKIDEKTAEKHCKTLTESQQKLFSIFKVLKDVSSLSRSGNSEDIRRMFVAICQDMRVVIVKFATLLFDLKQISEPMSSHEREFVHIVLDVFAPLAERLGLNYFKDEFEDNCFRLLEPAAFEELRTNALLKTEDNQKQIKITREKLQQILDELHIKGEIQARQKHFYSVYKKLVKKNITLGKVYDLVAMRVLVPTVDDCYSVFGKIHAIYKPIQGRVKDYIANPKPSGYQSLHTTIVADNNRPLEIQIRTFEMHKLSEYGIAAHWIYKEKKTRNKFDEKMSWFRQVLDSTGGMTSEEFMETLKMNLYGESIFVQTPKGKVLEFPLGSTIIDFAYAIHSDIGNFCVGGKVNGKLMPIVTELKNGDVVEILTNANSKGPSHDWLLHVKTPNARSKIRAFFKTELKEENIKNGKSILEQAIRSKSLNLSKEKKEEYLETIAKNLMMENVDTLFSEIGSGTLPVANVLGRIINHYNKDNSQAIKNDTIRVKKTKDGVLIDGDSGLLIRYAGCCNPIMGDDIVGYISRGRGVTIHRTDCENLKYLEKERLIKAEWQDGKFSDFVSVVKVVAENRNVVVNNINNAARAMKNKLKGFSYHEQNGELVFEIAVQVSSKDEIDKLIVTFGNVKYVKSVTRSE